MRRQWRGCLRAFSPRLAGASVGFTPTLSPRWHMQRSSAGSSASHYSRGCPTACCPATRHWAITRRGDGRRHHRLARSAGHVSVRACPRTDALYDAIAANDRAEIHQRVGRALIERHQLDIEEHLDAIAHHLAAAARPETMEEAAEYVMRAGDRAMRLFSYQQAAKQFERALGLVQLTTAVDEERRCKALNSLAEAVTHSNPSRAQGLFLDAARLGSRLDLPEEFVRSVLGLSATHWFSRGPGGPSRPRLALIERTLQSVGDAHQLLPPASSPAWPTSYTTQRLSNGDRNWRARL